MRALVLTAPHEFTVTEREPPRPGPGEALIRVRRVGICATDLATIAGHNPRALYPMTPGHELFGTLEQVPDGTAHAVGDGVTVYPTMGCGRCWACFEGEPNRCDCFSVFGVHRDGGCFAEWVSVPVRQLLALPPALQGDGGALVEPTAVATHAIRRAGLRPGDRVAVIGVGAIGSLIAEVARASGAGGVALVDRLPERADLAGALGFEHFVSSAVQDLGVALRGVLDGPLDVVFDTVCVEQTLRGAADALATTGVLVAIAYPHGADMTLPYTRFYMGELSLVLSRNYAPRDFRRAIDLLAQGSIRIERLITGTYPLEDFSGALHALRCRPQDHVKILIEP